MSWRWEGFSITREQALCALMVLPFVEPLSLNIFVRQGFYPGLFSALGDVFLFGRLAVASWAFLTVLRRLVLDKFVIDNLILLLFIHMGMLLVSCLFNGSRELKIVVQVYSHLGFLIACALLIERSPREFLQGCILCFGTLSVLGTVSIFLYPQGMIRGDDPNSRYYLLGAKNTAFPYYFCFLLSWAAYSGKWKKRLPKLAPVILIFIAAARICDSSSSTACLALLLLFYLLAQYAGGILRRLRPSVLLAVLVAAVVLIYMGMVFSPFAALLHSLGRGTSFTGRDKLWQQAIQYFRASPLFGSGENLVYTLRGGLTTAHAHSQYLNRLAKYGIAPFVFFVVSLVVLERRLESSVDRLLTCLMGSFLVVYLLHMSFDDYTYNFFLLLMMIVNFVAAGEKRNPFRYFTLRA